MSERWTDAARQLAGLAPLADRAARDAGEFVALVDGFVAAIEAQIARWTAILHMFQLAMMALAIGSAVMMLYAGYLFVLNPLARLQRGLTAVQQGDLSTRVEVDSGDEFGQLSAGFNDMARTLQSLYGSLEEKVREKTARLEVKRQRLADLYEVSAFLARATSLDELARGFARQVRRVAKADAAAVRWSDEGNQRYLLLAADGLPPAMAEAESCLETGACHCGQPRAQAAHPRRSRSARLQPAPLAHCRRAGFRTLVSVPVKLHERVLGEVDLFYRRRGQLRRRGARPARHAGQPPGQRHGEPARRGAGARGGGGAGARPARAGTARFDRAVAGVPEDPGRSCCATPCGAATPPPWSACSASSTPACARATPTCASCWCTSAPAPARRTSSPRCAPRCPSSSTRPACAPAWRWRATAWRWRRTCRCRCCTSSRRRCRTCASTPARARSCCACRPLAVLALRGARRRHGLRCWTTASRDETHVGLRIMRERAQRIGATVKVDSSPGRGCSVVLELPPRPRRGQRPSSRPKARGMTTATSGARPPHGRGRPHAVPARAGGAARLRRALAVVGEASDAGEAVRKAATLQPDVILLDNHLPGATRHPGAARAEGRRARARASSCSP